MYECKLNYVQNWIKLIKPQNQQQNYFQQINKSIKQKLAQTQQNTTQAGNKIKNSKNEHNLFQQNRDNSTYISSILSLQKLVKKDKKGSLKHKKRLLYHNYQKYKTIPFQYDKIYTPQNHNSDLVNNLNQKIHDSILYKKQNSCILTFGSFESQMQNIIEGSKNQSEGIFYKLIVKIHQKFKSNNNKNEQTQWQKVKINMNFMAVSQQKIIDLLDVNNQIHFRDNNKEYNFKQNLHNQNFNHFHNPLTYQLNSNYQFYTQFKKVCFRRKQLNFWNVFIVKINFQIMHPTNQTQLRHVLLVQWIKDNSNLYLLNENKKQEGHKSLLALNQCILQILKVKQQHLENKQSPNQISKNKNYFSQNYLQKLSKIQSFRNSLITRLLRNLLLFNSSFIFLGCCSINQQHHNETYQTLMLGKNISKLSTLNDVKLIQMDAQKCNQSNELMLNQSIQQHKYEQNQLNNDVVSELAKQYTKYTNDKRLIKSYQRNKSLDIIQNNHQNTLKKQKQNRLRNQLVQILQEAKSKQLLQDPASNEYNKIYQKYKQEKIKNLKTKKQINILKLKSITKNLRNKLISSNKHTTQNQINQIDQINNQIQRLLFQHKRSQKYASDINEEMLAKIVNQTENPQLDQNNKLSTMVLQQQKQRKIKTLKQYYKRQLQINEIQINNYLQQQESLKSIYYHELNLLNKYQKQFKKDLSLNKNQFTKSSTIQNNLQINKNQKLNYSPKRVVLIKQMQSSKINRLKRSRIYQSLDFQSTKIKNNDINKNRSINYQDNKTLSLMNSPELKSKRLRYSEGNINEREFKNVNKERELKNSKKYFKNSKKLLQTIDVDKIKGQHKMIRKNQYLKNRVQLQKQQHLKYLQSVSNKYMNYQPKNKYSLNQKSSL